MAGLVKRVKRRWRRAGSSLLEQITLATPNGLRRRLETPGRYLHMLFVDHGIFRFFYVNSHRLPGEAWRSAQPAPRHIRRFAKAGVRTIINLRGERDCGSFYLERRACEKYGIELVNFVMRSRDAPTREDIHAARKLFQDVEYPILIHCKSGADRAGIMSALYCYLHEGETLEQAQRQLSLRYGHFRQAHTGVLDYFFERYIADTADRPMPFLEWVDTVYDPQELKRTFRSKGWANRLVDSILRRE